MFARLGKMVTAHPWRVIAVWIAAVAVIVPLAPSLSSVSNSNSASFLPSSSESVGSAVKDSLSLKLLPSGMPARELSKRTVVGSVHVLEPCAALFLRRFFGLHGLGPSRGFARAIPSSSPIRSRTRSVAA